MQLRVEAAVQNRIAQPLVVLGEPGEGALQPHQLADVVGRRERDGEEVAVGEGEDLLAGQPRKRACVPISSRGAASPGRNADSVPQVVSESPGVARYATVPSAPTSKS